MAKKSKRKKLIEKLDDICREIIRERDDWTCQRCGKKVDIHNAQASHVVPKSTGYILRWDLLNLKLLCYSCHFYWWHKDITEAAKWFRKKWPYRWRYVEKKRYKTVIWSNEKLELLLAERQKKSQRLRK